MNVLGQAVTVVDSSRWLSLHLYREQGLRPILLDLMPSTLRELFSSAAIDRFFFIRYQDEGGLHVRLRLRLLQDEEHCFEQVLAICGDRCTAVPIRFEPETERYGGAEVLAHSLGFFSISSSHALTFESSFGDRPQSRKLTLQLCTLLWQAWGFARDTDELLALLDYFSSWAERHQRIIVLADEFFESNQGTLVRLFRGELERLSATSSGGVVSLASAGSLSDSAHALSREVSEIDIPRRWSTGTSQMHMTANRLGLTNMEESYCSRVLVRVVGMLIQSDPDFVLFLGTALDRRNSAQSLSLEELARRHLAALSDGLRPPLHQPGRAGSEAVRVEDPGSAGILAGGF